MADLAAPAPTDTAPSPVAVRRTALFPTLADGQIAALAARGEEVRLDPGERLFAEGGPLDSFYVVLEGAVRITKGAGDLATTLTTHGPAEFVGELAVLTGEPSVASAHAAVPSRLVRVPAEAFRRVLLERPDLADAVLGAMTRRLQDAELMVRQREKLASLGALAAGLAHELNNPASAARRAAGQLEATVEEQEARAAELRRLGLPAAAWEDLLAVRARALPGVGGDPLARSDAEDALGAWLDERGITGSWALAPGLVAAGLDAVALDAVAEVVPPVALGAALGWLAAALSTRELVGEVTQSTGRIAELVDAARGYTYLDQAPRQEIDVHDGLESTLAILGHRLRDTRVLRDYDRSLPRLCAYGAELNQVWTNLLDNALIATGGAGTVRLRTAREGDRLLVEVGDDGPGIPSALHTRIFEPFFTTRPPGEGVGLGLDIARRIVVDRHGGEIAADSVPGDTLLRVWLPIPPAEEAPRGESPGSDVDRVSGADGATASVSAPSPP
ncbi:MAG: hypothetical protein AVDCRST_MAG49-3828 [uncultured Thermomicrobiales bacterium]|uniref:histidine kinase n=1 Tax=uncultured Thermomicrobiales bacterium TaxID=1645740 RepID=A0A6J4V9Y0_9BACT|nr:MAG: hypothetical protein AVDCRST_MAG49-3828 [uncultured Thermomicrobiales bacterium]